MSNVKELKEAIAFAFVVTKIVKGQLADGYQNADIIAIAEQLTSEEAIESLKIALEGAQSIPTEASEAGLFGGLELVQFVLGQIKTLG